MTRRRAILGALAGTLAAFVLAIGCSDDPHRRTAPGQILGGGGACEALPGTVPPPDCDNSSRACAASPGCTIDEVRCGRRSTCLPLGDNRGKDIVDLRFRRLNIAAPPALASDLIQNTVVNTNLDLAEPTCAERGTGLFTWILRVDKKASTIVTGGAPPSADPLGVGFCFADFQLGATKIAPIEAKVAFANGLGGSRTFTMIDAFDVNIPIFFANDLTSAVVLPISGARIVNATLSEDGNCIGAFHDIALDPACIEDRTLCPKWTTSGSLGGHITLEAADKVTIRELGGRSLCAFLAAENGQACARDGAGKIAYQGDFCSIDRQAGSCRDSVWLAATFAASAAKIVDGRASVPGCGGGSTSVDGGTDAAPIDASDQ